MIYELKKYQAHPGKAQALKERFERVTLPLFERAGIQVLYCFEEPAEPEAFYYLTVFPDEAAREAAWQAFGADPEWQRAKAATEQDGPLLASQSTTVLRQARFSPGWE